MIRETNWNLVPPSDQHPSYCCDEQRLLLGGGTSTDSRDDSVANDNKLSRSGPSVCGDKKYSMGTINEKKEYCCNDDETLVEMMMVDREEPSNVHNNNDNVRLLASSRAQYPGAVYVPGSSNARDDEEGTIVIGGEDDATSQQTTPLYVVGQTELSPPSPSGQRPSRFHRAMDQIGLSALRPQQITAAYFEEDDERKKQRVLRIMELVIALMLATAATVISASLALKHTRRREARKKLHQMIPSSAPSFSHERSVVLTAEFVGSVDTFGFGVDLNDEGTRIAIAAPRANNGTGQVEVYDRAVMGTTTSSRGFNEWTRLGDPIMGDAAGDNASFGMDLSNDGEVLAVGYPGNGNGFVRVFEYSDHKWRQRGQTIEGPSMHSRFGATVSLNWKGTALAVGAPLAGDQEQGMFQVFLWTGTRWASHGSARYGQNSGDGFATAVGMDQFGNSVVVGVPNHDDTANGEDAGMVQIFGYTDANLNNTADHDCLAGCWTDVSFGTIVGHGNGSRLGQKVSSLVQTRKFYEFVITSSPSHLGGTLADRSGAFADSVRYIGFEKNRGFVRLENSFSGDKGSSDEGRLGYDVDFDDEYGFFCATTQNNNNDNYKQTGTVQCFGRAFRGAVWNTFSNELEQTIHPLQLGNGMWFGMEPNIHGPSVSVTALSTNKALFAVGYQSVKLMGGEDAKGVVRIYQLQLE